MHLLARGDGGIVRGPLPPDTTRTSILVAMLTLSIYMSLVVDIQIFTTFKRRNTVYFWSLFCTSCGIVSHSIGIILKWFVGSCPWYVNTAFASFGWWGMVTGQSLVLYSRLHLVIRSQRVLRSVLAMIILDFCIFQVPTTVLTFGSNREDPGLFLTVYNVYERIQLVVFTLQELVISILYIRAAFKMLLPDYPRTEPLRMTKRFLIYLNVLCIILDVAFVCEVYSGEWVYKTGTQSLAYAIKLTIEFIVLNKLMEVYRVQPVSCAMCKTVRPGGLHPSEYGYWSRPQLSVAAHTSAVLGSWQKGKSKMNAPLGSFVEIAVEQELESGRRESKTYTAEEETLSNHEARKGITVTTGISTWSERRSGLSSPVEEKQEHIDPH